MSADPVATQEQAPQLAPALDAAPSMAPAAPAGPIAAGFGNAAVSRALASGVAPQHLMSLRPGMGNAALGRILAPQRILARQDHEPPTPAELAEADAWAAEGIKRGNDLTPGNTGAGLANAGGGFDAEYDPTAGELTIIMRCGVEFVDGIAADGTPAAGLEEQAEAIRNLPTEIERQQRLALFRWSPDAADPEKVAFKTGVESQIEGFWGGRHEFFLRKRGWSWLGATVRIDIQVDDKANLPNDHLTMRPVKVPSDVDFGAFVTAGDLANAQDQTMTLSSNLGAQGQFLQHSITFGIDSSAIVGDQAGETAERRQHVQGRGDVPGRRRPALAPDAGRAHRPRERHRLGGAQPGPVGAARGRRRGLHGARGVRQRDHARERRGRRRGRGDRRRGGERAPRRHRDRQRRRPEHAVARVRARVRPR